MDRTERKPGVKAEDVQGVSRRSFLKCAALGTAGAAVVGLAGCAPPGTADEDDDSGGAADSAANGSFMGNVPNWLGSKPEITDISREEECEILVLGTGNSGFACALKAQEDGADVLVVEPQTRENYDNFACDMASYNSKTFLDAGAPLYDTTLVFNEYMRKSFSKASPSLLRQFVTRSGEAIDWVVEHVPQETRDQYMFTCNCPDGPRYFSGESCGSYNFIGMIQWRNSDVKVNADVWPQVVLNHIDAFEAAGGRHIWGAKGAVLVQNDAGDVTGCICEDADGTYFQVNASKAVVLACGDYGANPDMLLDLTDQLRNLAWSVGNNRTDVTTVGGMGRDGSGIKMGLWAGGTMEPGPRAPMSTGVAGGRPGFPFGGCWPVFGPDGKRFYNEAITKFGNQGVYNNMATGILCSTIVDATWREGLEYQDYGHSSMDLSNKTFINKVEADMAAYQTGPEGFPVQNFMVYGEAYGTVYAADTLEELGQILGYEGAALQGLLDEVEHYNAMCDKKHDDDWGYDPQLMFPIRQAPFFGTGSMSEQGVAFGGLVQLAGLNTNDDQQVLRADKSSIKGLYATGNCCGNRYAVQYHTPTSGNSCGMAITLGYVLGENLAKA
ncbi:MAG: FAD-binding protein [Coriobacteriales bacterium]|nr:FAD-binding protein [Coriobacteriales bacterium]